MSGRKRYVAVGNKWVEVSSDYTPEPKNHDGLLYNDRAYQDMNDPRFRSRTEHREYMKQHGVCTYDDFASTFKKNEQARMELRTQNRLPDASRKEDVARALYEHTQRRK